MKSEITLKGDRLCVRTPYAPALVDRFRTIPGRLFDGTEKVWTFPAVKDVLLMVCDAVGQLPWMLSQELRDLGGKDNGFALEKVAVDLSVIDGHPFITEPYAHQRVNLARLVQNNRWILADEMGTGKTHAVVNRLLRQSAVGGNVLILCPKSVIGVWNEQLATHGRISAQFVVYEGTTNVQRGSSGYWITITNYEQLLFKTDAFLAMFWQTVVLDEIHRVKNFTAKTSRIVRQLTTKAKYVYGLSGTPAPNGLEDWFGVLSAVDPSLLPVNTKTAFYNRYCVRTQLPNGVWIVSGYRNVQELHGYVARICSRVTKAECLDLPEKVYSTRIVTLAGEQARVYRELKKDAVARLGRVASVRSFQVARSVRLAGERAVAFAEDQCQLTVNNVLTESLRLLQVVGGFVPDDDGTVHELPDKSKVEALADLIEEAGERQMVIWCAFRAEVAWLAQWLKDQYQCGVATLTGETPGQEREWQVDRFRRGDARFFVGTAAAGGLGINGLQVADTEVFYSRDWRLDTYLQATDRLHRIGQKNIVHVIRLVAAGTVDEKVNEALERKANLQEMLLQDPEKLF
jgi:SNF2 family DNA or RNA helicase